MDALADTPAAGINAPDWRALPRGGSKYHCYQGKHRPDRPRSWAESARLWAAARNAETGLTTLEYEPIPRLGFFQESAKARPDVVRWRDVRWCGRFRSATGAWKRHTGGLSWLFLSIQ